MARSSAEANEAILEWVEEIGGGYVWEREIFAVTLLDSAIGDDEAARVGSLVGVDQILVNITNMSIAGLTHLASADGLESLVVEGRPLHQAERERISEVAPDLEVVEIQ